jgi:hypothetical protein
VQPLDSMFAVATGINNNGWITADGGDGCCGFVLVPHARCPADVTGTGEVGLADVLALVDAWGERSGEATVAADVNNDGRVDAIDLLELLSAWGTCR